MARQSCLLCPSLRVMWCLSSIGDVQHTHGCKEAIWEGPSWQLGPLRRPYGGYLVPVQHSPARMRLYRLPDCLQCLQATMLTGAVHAGHPQAVPAGSPAAYWSGDCYKDDEEKEDDAAAAAAAADNDHGC